MAYERRSFSGNAAATTLNGSLTDSATSLTLTSGTAWPVTSGGAFIAVIDEGTASEEVILVGARSGAACSSITRGYQSTTAAAHSNGAAIRHVIGLTDVDEANYTVGETVGKIAGAGEILIGDGANSLAALDVKTSGRIVVGNGTTATSVAVSGDVTLSSTGAVAIANNKITNAMMTDNSVDTAEIADNAVTAAKIAANAVDSSEIAANAVGSSELADNAVDTAAIAAAAVTYAKLDVTAGTAAVRRIVEIQVTDPAGSALTTGDGKAYFVVPSDLNGLNLIDADAFNITASSSGTPTVMIHNLTDTADMLSTAITIDANEKTSFSAAVPPVINTSTDDVATGDIIRIDVDVAGTGTKGLGVILVFG